MQKILITIFILIQFICSAQEKTILKTYSSEKLYEDFDLMVNSLKEAHAGLYWYNSKAKFDSITLSERAKIKDGMNSYEFFRIVSKIITTTKEGHCRIGSSRDVGEYFNQKALLIPIIVKMLNGKLYLLNDIESHKTKGQIIKKINNVPIENIIETIFDYSPKFADGNITSGKIRYSIDNSGLAYYYADFFKNEQNYTLELVNSKTNKISTINANALYSKEFAKLENEFEYSEFKNPIELKIDNQKNIAQLSIHSFRHTFYDKEGNEEVAFTIFRSKIDSVFSVIQKNNIQNLIIDIRNNGGGTEGYEDYVFSYLTDKPYSKYKYVQANALSFSFLKHTQYNTPEKQRKFEQDMKNEFSLENDGRYLRKENFMLVEKPKQNSFKGKIYVLISGKTYSGGSEFAGLLKSKTNAIFIGEETAGGFYGQTSGFGITLTLPNTQTRIRIPLLKFVTNFESEDIPFGRGIIPDYEIQPNFEEYNKKIDKELEFTIKLIEKK